MLCAVIAVGASFSCAANFTQDTSSILGTDLGCVAWGDYDNDGYQDLFICGSTLNNASTVSRLYHNNGNGTFSENTSATAVLAQVSTNGRNASAWADFDNDGDLDLLLTGDTAANAHTTHLYRNDGAAGFVDLGDRGMVHPTDGSVACADYDGDGKVDVYISSNGFPNQLYRNTGSNNFTQVTSANVQGAGSGGAAWGDYDNDGFPDLLITGIVSGPVTKLYHNNTDGTFTENTSSTLSASAYSACAWGDYDGDGYLDFATIGLDSSYSAKPAQIYHNNGDGTFTDIGVPFAKFYFGSVAWADFDNDGDLDLLLSGATDSGNKVELYRNDGAGVFTPVAAGDFTAMRTTNTAWADFDNDGKIDAVMGGIDDAVGFNGTKRNILYHNITTTANTAPSVPTGLSSSISGTTVTFSWAAASDAESPVNTLGYNLRVGTSSGAFDTYVPNALSTGPLTLPSMGNAGHKLSHSINTLANGQVYYWSVQAVDQSYMTSAFAPEAITGSVPVTLSGFKAE